MLAVFCRSIRHCRPVKVRFFWSEVGFFAAPAVRFFGLGKTNGSWTAVGMEFMFLVVRFRLSISLNPHVPDAHSPVLVPEVNAITSKLRAGSSGTALPVHVGLTLPFAAAAGLSPCKVRSNRGTKTAKIG